MPRSYGVTNIAPWSAAPPVGPAGDTYYNTGNKSLYISDGTVWNQIQASGGATGPTGPAGAAGGAYTVVAATAPPPASLPIAPPAGALWVDTSTAASWVPYQIPGPTGATGPPGPYFDGGNQMGVDNNTLLTPGVYVNNDAGANAPPIPPGQYVLEVTPVMGNSIIQQRATLISQPNFFASREFSIGPGWGAWRSPPAGVVTQLVGPATAYSGGAGTCWGFSMGPVWMARKYKVTVNFYVGLGANTSTFFYATFADGAMHVSDQWNNNQRFYWVSASIATGASFTGGFSREWFPNQAYPANNGQMAACSLGINGTTTMNVPINACSVLFEDVGV